MIATGQGGAFSGTGASNVTGPNALASYRAFETQPDASALSDQAIASTDDAAGNPLPASAAALADRDAADAATLALRGRALLYGAASGAPTVVTAPALTLAA